MKLENLERAKELIAEIEKCEGMLAIAKSPDLELVGIDFNYYWTSSSFSQNSRVTNKSILKTIHDMYVLELERELVELKAELETL